MVDDIVDEYKMEETRTVSTTIPPSTPEQDLSADAETRGNQDLPLAMYIMATVVVVGFFLVLLGLMFIDIPAANVGSANQLFGILSSAFAGVLGFFYGSSIGSRNKEDAIADIAKRP